MKIQCIDDKGVNAFVHLLGVYEIMDLYGTSYYSILSDKGTVARVLKSDRLSEFF